MTLINTSMMAAASFADISKAERPNVNIKRVNVDFPA